MIQFHLSSKANDSEEYYGDDDDEDGGHDPHPHSPPVPCSRVPNDNHSNTLSSLQYTNPTETWLGMTTVDTVFARTSRAKHGIQLNTAMNMRCFKPRAT